MLKYLFPKLVRYVQFGGQTVPAFPCQTKRECVIHIYPFAPHWEIPMLKVEELLKFIAIQYVLFY